MSSGFVHSVKVPRIYKVTANIIRSVQEDGASLKTLIYEKKHPNVSGIYALSVNTLQKGPLLDILLRKTGILIEQPRLDPWLARILITELLWGKKTLSNNSKPIQTVLAYENKLRDELNTINNAEAPIINQNPVQRPRYIRINTLLLSVEEAISFFQEEGWELLPRDTNYSSYLESLSQLSPPYFIQDLHISEVLVFPPATIFHEHNGYKNGKFVLQDKASCLPAYLLNPTNGSTVLDMCAAPGMKATHLAAKLQNNGKVYAVEIDSKRFETLCDQIKITNSLCVEPINKDALTLNPMKFPDIEYILVDPSCSGSGIIDRPKQNYMDGQPETRRFQNLQSFQVYLLRNALFNFPTAKRVVYSTCSIHPEENEEVIDEVLADIGDAYKLLPIKQLFNNNWINYSSTKYNCKDNCLYAKPETDYCNGFFVAVFERNFDKPLPECKRKGGNSSFIDPIMSTSQLENTTEKVACKKKKRGKKKNKFEDVTTAVEMTKELQDEIIISVSKIRNNNVNVCTEPDLNNEDAKLTELESIESKQLQKKKISKRTSQIEKDTEILNISDTVESETLNDIEPAKKKRKKKQNKETYDVPENEQNEITVICDESLNNLKVTKKKKKMKKNKESVDIDNVQKSKKHKEIVTDEDMISNTEPSKKKKRRVEENC